MPARLRWGLIGSLALFFGLSGAALASGAPAAPAQDGISSLILLTFLLPGGLILLCSAALTEERAVAAATGAVVAWGVAIIAYFAAGFAFQFGGIAVVHDAPDLAGLYLEYSLLDVSWGSGWGMIGLRGFLLARDASTPGALTLFLAQLPLLGVAALGLHFALWERTRRWVMLPAGLFMGGVVYPVLGNWVWGGGWLANLGLNFSYGHGLVDAAGGGQAALTGAAAALAAALAFRTGRARSDNGADAFVEPQGGADVGDGLASPMPAAHLPLLAWLGALLMVVGWMATAAMAHVPGAGNVSLAVIAVNMLLAAFGGALTASLYAWFATGRLDVLMAGRGIAAGLVVAAAGAPFLPPWAALTAGLVVGLLLPPLLFLLDRTLALGDSAAQLASFGLPAVLGLLLPGLLADGRYGAGWNRVGLDSFLGVQGQGVSGVLTAAGMAADWPGQMTAQLIGVAAIVVWVFSLSWLVLRGLGGIIHAWERSGLEFGAPPPPVPLDEEPVSEHIEPPVADTPIQPAATPREDPAVGGSAH